MIDFDFLSQEENDKRVQICGDVFLVDGVWVDALGREVPCPVLLHNAGRVLVVFFNLYPSGICGICCKPETMPALSIAMLAI